MLRASRLTCLLHWVFFHINTKLPLAKLTLLRHYWPNPINSALLISSFFIVCSVQGQISQHKNNSPVGPYPVEGWPVILGNRLPHTPAVADIDGDGRDEVAVGLKDGRIFLLDGGGRIKKGWSQVAENEIRYSPVFIDLDGDGKLEILAACINGYLYAWRLDGSSLSDWPVNLRHAPAAAPRIVQIRSDQEFSILIACSNGSVYLLDHKGANRPGWPKNVDPIYVEQHVLNPVQWADLDHDGIPEILVLTHKNAILHAWNLNGERYPGFPLVLGGAGRGIAVNDYRNPTHIAITGNYDIITLDTSGLEIFRFTITDRKDRFYTSPAFISLGTLASGNKDIVTAATRGGQVFLLDRGGAPLPGGRYSSADSSLVSRSHG